MKNTILITILGIATFIISCDNNTKVNDSKKESNKEAILVEQEKLLFKNTIDSLNSEISILSKEKNIHMQNVKFAEAEIYNILKSSFLDHIIIGTKNLEYSKNFFRNKLGFKIKDGKNHKNGISNFFVEFEDSSEIEIMSIVKPLDKMAKKYEQKISGNNFGLQYVIRTNRNNELAKNFETIQSDYTELSKNKIYSTISKSNIDQQLPVFFIQYEYKNENTLTKHINGSNGLSTIWLSTPNLRKTINQYSEFGFGLVDTLTVANIKSKTALMKNDNFEVILIESKNYGIVGITIKTEKIEEVKKLLITNLSRDFKISENKRGQSIYLSPQITNSIWFEFLDN